MSAASGATAGAGGGPKTSASGTKANEARWNKAFKKAEEKEKKEEKISADGMDAYFNIEEGGLELYAALEAAAVYNGFDPKAFKLAWFRRLKASEVSAETAKRIHMFIIVVFANRGTNLRRMKDRMPEAGKDMVNLLIDLGVVSSGTLNASGAPIRLEKDQPSISRVAAILVKDVCLYLCTPTDNGFRGRAVYEVDQRGLLRANLMSHFPSVLPRGERSVNAIKMYMLWQEGFSRIINQKNKDYEFDAERQMTYALAMTTSDYIPEVERGPFIAKLIRLQGMEFRDAMWAGLLYPYNEVLTMLSETHALATVTEGKYDNAVSLLRKSWPELSFDMNVYMTTEFAKIYKKILVSAARQEKGSAKPAAAAASSASSTAEQKGGDEDF